MGGMTRLLLLLWAGVTVGSLVDLQKRIIGGKDCKLFKRGYHVSLTSNGQPFCSGTLISKEWILTAAHCYEPGRTIKAVLGRKPESDKTREIEGTPRFIEDKDNQGNTKKHDIMLLKLREPTMTIPVGLPNCNKKPKRGDKLKIAGYASTAGPGDNITALHRIDLSKLLQCAKTKVDDCDAGQRCMKSVFQYPHIFCFQDDEVDITPGDSGAGVVYKHKIYGVAVTGYDIACTGPAASIDICADVYKKWIKETTLIHWPKLGTLG